MVLSVVQNGAHVYVQVYNLHLPSFEHQWIGFAPSFDHQWKVGDNFLGFGDV